MSQLKIKDGNSWINIPAGGVGVPSGGNANDVLIKSSSTDYATEWESLNNIFIIEQVTIDNITVSANGYSTQSFDLTKQGYRALALAGFSIGNASDSGTNSTNMLVRVARVQDATTGMISARNIGSAAAKVKYEMFVLYIKN